MPRITIAALAAITLTGCATVRQGDLDAWAGMPVEALDTHSFFVTVPMIRTFTEGGIEIRNYANSADFARCGTVGNASLSRSGRTVTGAQFTQCSSQRVTCNNLFYLRGGKVLEYKPTGSCFTDGSLRPEDRYRRLTAPG